MDAPGLTMPIISFLRRFRHASHGGTAIEFALVMPAYAGMIVGGMFLCLALFTASSLQYAVQMSARCASVNTTSCASSTTTIAYAKSAYRGPSSPAPTFTYSTGTCGYKVKGTVSYVFDFGEKRVTFPISTSACFP
jgi:Flp pilus assembly protein TadG